MTTAREVISDAFGKVASEAIEAPMEDVELQKGLRALNRMMAALTLDVGWTPVASLGDTLTIGPDVEEFVVNNLALKIAPDFQRPVPPELGGAIRLAWANLLPNYQILRAPRFPTNMPMGSGSTYDGYAQYGGDGRSSTDVDADYTLLLTDDQLLVDCSDGPVTISLPTASSASGYGFSAKKIDGTGNSVILDPNGSEQIDNRTTLPFWRPGQEVFFRSNGSRWLV